MVKLFKAPALRRLLRPYNGRLVTLSALTVIQSLLQVVMALLTRFVIDAALSGTGQLSLWGTVLVLDLMAMVAVHTLLAWLSGSTADKFSAQLRGALLRAAAYSRDLRLQQFHSGQLLSRGMEDVNTVCDGAVNALPSLVGQVTRLVAAFAAVLLISPGVAVVLSAAAVVIGALTALARPALKSRHRVVRQTDEKVMSTMQEDLQQLELIQSLDAQAEILHRFDTRLKSSLVAKCKRRILSVSVGSAMNIGTLAGTGAVLLWGAAQVAKGSLSYGSLTSMLQLLSLFRGPVLGLSGLWTRLAAVDVAGERLTDLLDAPEPKEPRHVPEVTAILFDSVTFCYPGDEAPVLRNFSARFPLEKWACLTGISGKGKTTLFKLILGLYTPQSGTVCLETPQGNIPCGEDTRHLFAYVPQDYALFSGTILENLQLVADGDETRHAEALAVAQADFVWELTGGENTQVRENNTGLSKGQIQRLAIARAVLMERPILLLDECTSALDAATEAAVLRGLYDLGKQAILVTHRPDALTDLPAVTSVSMEQ